MTGKTRYNLAVEALKEYDSKVLHISMLRKIIMQKLASVPNIVTGYLKLLEATGVTKEVKPFEFLIKIENDKT